MKENGKTTTFAEKEAITIKEKKSMREASGITVIMDTATNIKTGITSVPEILKIMRETDTRCV